MMDVKMTEIYLLDGSTKIYHTKVTGLDVAKSISSSLAKAAVAVKVDGDVLDLCDLIPTGSRVSILDKTHPESLDIMRHTIVAQVLGKAIKNLYPDSQLAIGPTIKDGFYYDFHTDRPVSSENLIKIESEMKKIVASGNRINKKIISRKKALELFKKMGEKYKVKIIEESNALEFQVYEQENTGFFDLCHGPHLDSLSKVGSFALTKVSGAYWKGESKNEMLVRIYGTAWFSQADLESYIDNLKEAEKRDHRKISQAMDLFHFQGEAPGQVFWHNNGWTLYKILENRIRTLLKEKKYQEVNTPVVINKDLFEQSGHWDKFGSKNMFLTKAYGSTYALKPMNCPCHVQIFRDGIKSYKDLPIKMSEFGSCYRKESRGALHGLFRVASMTQDDAHIFCTPQQIEDEVVEISEMIAELYEELGFKNYKVRFSDRPEQRIGEDSLWDHAENSLMNAAKRAGLKCELNKGDGAFYGPKIEFVLTDALGREWQCGTIQLDFNLPVKLDATYIDENGIKQHPIMIHRALLGSMERFIGMLIEHFSGVFPLWLSPIQVILMGISEKHEEHLINLNVAFIKEGVVSKIDYRNESLNYKIRDNFMKKVSYIGVIGDKELQSNTISVRRLGSKKQKSYNQEEFLQFILQEIENKTLPKEVIGFE